MRLRPVVDPFQVEARASGAGLSRRNLAFGLLAGALVVVALAFGVAAAVNASVGI